MISSRLRLVALFFLFCAFALVISTPTPKDVVLKRSTGDDILSILTTIKVDIDVILPELGTSNLLSF
jgi:hypothetical protein